ncbi:MAG: hypothetical protein ACYC8T_06005 [Myxococcaceae bacterium]
MAQTKRRAVQVRRAHLPRGRKGRFAFGAFRFVLYGFVGLASEIIFYNVVKFGRKVPGLELLFRFEWKVDKRLNLDAIWDAPLVSLYGQCSLWMFLVYAIAAFFLVEYVYRRGARWPLLLRALIYGLGILAFEALSGLALEQLTGYRIWYYEDPLAIVGMTSLYILPIWMVTGLVVELLYRELMDPTVAAAIESTLATPQLQETL